ncbi:DMT family transporter [Belliella pelovolcani]|jgi:drug/metabolite transporter (DMT)-like permease|uniref:EamA domain-containing membrane protein RarD n=1 Tax=Belliella pelovolcani TaxID=529505 RepID=A0A1N7M4Y6_9BACT|nr:DMT family transporter [Belliella pelovolcani]SIS81102.1 EamA domain-containing membrane protein RarD [Belliella pelovolcani]
MLQNATIKDYLMLHFIVVIWGFTAILGLLISIPSVEIVFYRTLLASGFLGLVFLVKKQKVRLSQQELGKVIGTGFLISLHWILFFWAARVSTASVCLAGMATTSLWTAFIEPMVNKSKIKWFEILLGMMVISGLYVVFSFEGGYWLGLSMAVASALIAAIFTVINGRLTKRHSPYVLTFYEMLGACIFSVLFMPFYAAFFTEGAGLQLIPQGWDWFWLFLLGGVCTVYAFSVSVELMRRLTAFAINLTVNLEPVYGIVLAVLIFGEKEQMTPGFYLGTLIILISVLLYPVFNYFNRRRQAKRVLGV